MAKPIKAQFEEKLDKPLCETLIEAFNRYGSLRDASKALGITHTTMSLWLKDCGYTTKTVLVPIETDKD